MFWCRSEFPLHKTEAAPNCLWVLLRSRARLNCLGVATSVSLSPRFLCGTVNDFVADVGKAYGRAADNKQEAAIMAGKASGCPEQKSRVAGVGGRIGRALM